MRTFFPCRERRYRIGDALPYGPTRSVLHGDRRPAEDDGPGSPGPGSMFRRTVGGRRAPHTFRKSLQGEGASLLPAGRTAATRAPGLWKSLPACGHESLSAAFAGPGSRASAGRSPFARGAVSLRPAGRAGPFVLQNENPERKKSSNSVRGACRDTITTPARRDLQPGTVIRAPCRSA